jgi:WAS/WASL-interacting protein
MTAGHARIQRGEKTEPMRKAKTAIIQRSGSRARRAAALLPALLAAGLAGAQALPPPPGPYPFAPSPAESTVRFVPPAEATAPTPAAGFRDPSAATGGSDGAAPPVTATGPAFAPQPAPGERFAPAAVASDPGYAARPFPSADDAVAPAPWGAGTRPPARPPTPGQPVRETWTFAPPQADPGAAQRPPEPRGGPAPATTGPAWDPWSAAIRANGSAPSIPGTAAGVPPAAAPLPPPPPPLPTPAREPPPSLAPFVPDAGPGAQTTADGPRFRPTGPADWQ